MPPPAPPGWQEPSNERSRASAPWPPCRPTTGPGNVEIISTDAKGDAAKLAANLEDLLSKNVDAIVISGGPLESAPAALNAIKAAGEPVVLVDRKFQSGDYTSWLGPDNEAIGTQDGEFMAQRLTKGGKVAISKGGPADNSIGLYVPEAQPAGNLALNKPATADSQCAAAEAPAKAVNGSWTGGNADKWCSLGTSKWLRVDLQADRQIGRVVLRHAGAGGEKATWNTRDFDVQVIADGNTWTTVASPRGNTAAVTTHSFTPRTARYLRVNVITATSDTDRAARIYELKAYAS